jgi:hypothetical protein
MSLKHFEATHETELSKAFVRTVSPDMPLIRSRLCLIFGNRQRENVYNMALRAAQLYRQGSIKKIIVTGGVPFEDEKDNVTEAQYARKILIARGVKPSHILFDNQSTNTLENVMNARRLIQKTEGVLRREPMLCMGMNHATSRFLMTLAKNWPQVTPSFIGFDRFDRPKDQWHTCHNIVTLLQEDQSKWDEYIRRGHIKRVCPTSLQQKLTASQRTRRILR